MFVPFAVVVLVLFFIWIISLSTTNKGTLKEAFPFNSQTIVLHLPELTPLEKDRVFELFELLFFEIVPSKFKEIHVYSTFSNLDLDTIKDSQLILNVQISGESSYDNPHKYHLNLIPHKETPNVVPFFWAVEHLYVLNDILHPRLFGRSSPPKKHYFCCFIVSNGSSEPRNRFFAELSKHKFVHSLGSYNRNTLLKAPDRFSQPFFDFLGQFKFCICFENQQADFYMTEKLISAYASATIPVYWGCPQTPDIINLSSLVWVPDSSPQTYDQAIQEILDLDSDPVKYSQKFSQPLFKDNKLPGVFHLDTLKHKVKNKLKFL